MTDRDGSKLTDWIAVAQEAVAASDASAVKALSEAMDGWPIIIDVDGFGEDEELTDAFSQAVERLNAREQSASGELAQELGILISALTAT